jgi:ribosomal protein S18 acetylase RimI-like enzyme
MDTTHPALALRPITDADHPFLLRLYASTRADELARVPWTDQQTAAFVLGQFTAQHAWWTERYPGATFDLVLCGDRPVGRLYVDRSEHEIRIVDITIVPENRGRRFGERLIRGVFDEGDASRRAVSIHVERSNRARSLYERLGFEQRGGGTGVYLLMVREPAVLSMPAAPE